MLGNIFILGDSYSTFEGYVPEGYPCWYMPNYPESEKNARRPQDVKIHRADTTETNA